MHFNMPSASRRSPAEVVPMDAGLPEPDPKACFDNEKAPPMEMPYQAGKSITPQARRTKVFALDVQSSGEWHANQSNGRPC